MPTTADRARAELARRELSRRNVGDWCRYAGSTQMGPWRATAWQTHLSGVLQGVSGAVVAKESPRLIVVAPPQHGKSAVVAQRWPVWHIATTGQTVAVACYSADLAMDHSRAARTIAHGPEAAAVWPGIRATRSRSGAGYRRNDTDIVSNWSLANGGRYQAMGVGGALTGKSPSLIVVDDPFKDAEDARSDASRRRVWDWYTSVVLTRARAHGRGIVVMHTRWHEDDLVGRILDREPGRWSVVHYPVLTEPGLPDPLGTGPGLALDAETMDLDAIREYRELSPRDFAAMYQGRPSPEGGTVFQRPWLSHVYSDTPEVMALQCSRIILSMDAAATDGGGDWSVIQAWGQTGPAAYVLLGQVRERLDYPDLRRVVLAEVGRWRPAAVLIEDASHGRALAQDLAHVVPGLIPWRPRGDKVSRARAVTGLWQAGQVRVPERAAWVEDWRSEHLTFPAGRHDDQVDAGTMALAYLRDETHGAWTAEDDATVAGALWG